MSTPRGQSDVISSELAVAPDAASVALTEANRRTGTETVYLLHAGARAPVPLHREHVAFAPCEGGATVQWHGGWLLYADSMGKAAVIDTARGHRAIEVTGRVAGLPGMDRGFSAFWSGNMPPL